MFVPAPIIQLSVISFLKSITFSWIRNPKYAVSYITSFVLRYGFNSNQFIDRKLIEYACVCLKQLVHSACFE